MQDKLPSPAPVRNDTGMATKKLWQHVEELWGFRDECPDAKRASSCPCTKSWMVVWCDRAVDVVALRF